MKSCFYFYVAIVLAGSILPGQSFCQIKYQINLADNFNKKSTIKLSSVANRIKYIPLETNPDCILGRDYKVELTEKYIFIFDYLNLYRFSITGKFLNKIGYKGRGPGEYMRLGAGFAIDDIQKEVFLLDFERKKILVYKYDGTFLRDLKLQFIGQFISHINRKYIIHNNMFYNFFANNKPTFELEVIDFEGNQINQFESTLDRNKKYGLLLYPPHFFQYYNLTYYKTPLNDTIFCFASPREKNPYAIVSTGKYKRDEKDSDFRAGEFVTNERSIVVVSVEENNQYVFVIYVKGEEYRFVYNKNTKEGTNVYIGLKNLIENKREANYTKGLVNDLDGGFPFWPRKIQNDSILIDYRDAYEFKFLDDNWFRGKEILNKNQMEKLKKFSKTIDEMGNPVIIIAK